MRRFGQRDYLVPSAEYRVYPTGLYSPTVLDSLPNAAASTHTLATVTAHATPHTKGSWADLTASSPVACTLLTVVLMTDLNASATDTSTLVDIGTGGTGDSGVTTIIPNITVGANAASTSQHYQFPVSIPAGTRICARSQSAVTVKAISLSARLGRIANGVQPAAYVLTYGADTATSRGAVATYAGSSNTKGTYVAVGTVAERVGAVTVALDQAADTTMASVTGLVDIGYDNGSGAVTMIAPDIPIATGSSEFVRHYESWRLHACDVPAGCRLLARVAFSGSGNDGIGVTLHAAPWRF